MDSRHDSADLETLRQRAEVAMDEGQAPRVIEPLLERILELAEERDGSWVFANRHLAELKLQSDPWIAALHIRRLMKVKPQDDALQALMALAQGLLGNYHAAISAYRKALAISPDNPFYHHNLGHLIDVAMEEPEEALKHLERAVAGVGQEPEMIASLAHCLARLGRKEEAEALALSAIEQAPTEEEHERLLQWIRAGATKELPLGRASTGSGGDGPETKEQVLALAQEELSSDLSSAELSLCEGIWNDYWRERNPQIRNPAKWAAALHYATARMLGLSLTQKVVAERYGISATALSAAWRDLRWTLPELLGQ